jgi:hypothetical protein
VPPPQISTSPKPMSTNSQTGNCFYCPY